MGKKLDLLCERIRNWKQTDLLTAHNSRESDVIIASRAKVQAFDAVLQEAAFLKIKNKKTKSVEPNTFDVDDVGC